MHILTEISLKKASVTLLIAIALVAGGIYAALNISQELTPDLDFPLITVITTQPGAAPQDVASGVSEPLEQAVSNVSGLQSLQSVSSENFSILIAQFDFGRDMKEAQDEISRVVSGVQLPQDARTPEVTRLNINQTLPVIQLSLAGDRPTEELERIANHELVPRLRSIEGVQSVDVLGGVSRQVSIILDPQRMQKLGIGREQVAGALRANNVSIPSGSVGANGSVLPVRTVSQLTSLTDIEDLVVGSQPMEGQPPIPVAFSDIATVKVTTAPAGTISRTNGTPSVGIAVSKTQQGNTVQVANAAQEIAADVQAQLGTDLEISTVLDQSTIIEESITGLTREGLIGAIAAVIAIWIFLLSFRSAIVTAVSIPLSVVVALLVLFFQGFTLNILTLGGLTIAVGRVVDDSIVVLENIFRHVQEGDDLHTSALNGTREVAVAIFGSTMTTIAVFLPLGFVGGVVGVLFRPFALTVTFALLASLVVALTVVPVLARFFIGRRQLGRRQSSKAQVTGLQRTYTPVLAWALRHRVWTLVIAAIAFVGSFALVPFIPTTFLPQQGEKQFVVNLSQPPGSGTAEDTLTKAMEAEEIIAGLPDVDVYNTSISLGTGGGDVLSLGRAIMGQGTRGATIVVRLHEDADLEAVQELARQRLDQLEGVIASVGSGGGQQDVNSQLQLSVTGPDQETVRTAALQVLGRVQTVSGVSEISSAAAVTRTELAVRVDPQKALAAGLTGTQVAQQIRELTAGQTVTQVSLEDGQRLDVALRADPSYLSNMDALRDLPVGTTAQTPLSSIAAIEQTQAPTQVTRLDQKPSATVLGVITGENTGQINQEIQQAIDGLALPPGVEVQFGGALQQFQESFSTLFVGIAAAVLIVYIVMVLVMGSLLNPFVILFSLPLASIGALAALAITGRALGLPSLFGILMLVGIVVTNGIVLIDFVNQLRTKGYSVHDALMEGGRLRVRPVLMTAVTTILALIPMSLGFTEGAIIAAELATVVIGGLFTSTVLTLVAVPVIYSIVEGLKQKVSPAGARNGQVGEARPGI